MKESQVKIPLHLYQNLIKYFLMNEKDDFNLLLKIEQDLREKQDSLMRHVEFSVKIKTAKNKKAG